MQPFMTSPGMEEFQHGLGVFLGADGDLKGPHIAYRVVDVDVYMHIVDVKMYTYMRCTLTIYKMLIYTCILMFWMLSGCSYIFFSSLFIVLSWALVRDGFVDLATGLLSHVFTLLI